MAHQARALVGRGVGLGECGSREWIDRASRVRATQQHLAAMHLEPDDAGALGELKRPHIFRLRPRSEPRSAALVWLLVRCGEETRERGVLSEREHPTIGEERFSLVERLQRAIRCEPAVVKTPLPQLRERGHADASARANDSAVAFPPLTQSATVFPFSESRSLIAAAVAAAPAPSATTCPSTRRSRIAR